MGADWCLRELSAYAEQNPWTPLAMIYHAILTELSLARKVVEAAEAERFVHKTLVGSDRSPEREAGEKLDAALAAYREEVGR